MAALRNGFFVQTTMPPPTATQAEAGVGSGSGMRQILREAMPVKRHRGPESDRH